MTTDRYKNNDLLIRKALKQSRGKARLSADFTGKVMARIVAEPVAKPKSWPKWVAGIAASVAVVFALGCWMSDDKPGNTPWVAGEKMPVEAVSHTPRQAVKSTGKDVAAALPPSPNPVPARVVSQPAEETLSCDEAEPESPLDPCLEREMVELAAAKLDLYIAE